jgi:hypothetical protein
MDVSAGSDCAPSALREGAVENMAIGWCPSRPRSDTLLRISVSSNQDRNSPTTCTSQITRHDEDAADLRSWGIRPETATYSHSIINGFAKSLIRLTSASNRASFAVRCTATSSGIPSRSFHHRSTSIENNRRVHDGQLSRSIAVYRFFACDL